MTVLLGSFMSLLASDNLNPSTGERINVADSVLISYDDLRIANSKLMELEYEKRINTNLRQIVYNDSIVINDYAKLNEKLRNNNKKVKRQRNVCLGVAIVAVLGSIISFMK